MNDETRDLAFNVAQDIRDNLDSLTPRECQQLANTLRSLADPLEHEAAVLS